MSHKIVKKSSRRRFLSKVLLKLSKGRKGIIFFVNKAIKVVKSPLFDIYLLHISKKRSTFASDLNLNLNAAAGAAQSVGARKDMKKSANVAKMTAAEIMTAAAAILKRYGSISAVKSAAPGLREKYGAENWAAILGDIKAARAKDIKAAGDEIRGRVFTYRGILGAVFADAAKGKAWGRLCKYARRKYTGRDADTAAQVVRDYYANVDAAGAPVSRVRYITKSGGLILDTWEARPLTKSAAVSILEASLKGMEAAAVKSAKNGKDAAKDGPAVRDNVRDCGRIAAVYAVEADPVTGEFSAGARLDKDTKDRKADAAAARLVGRQVPSDASTLAEINAAIRAARADAAKAPKATATEKHAAKAPKGSKGKGKAPKAAPAVTSAAAAAVAAA